MNLGGRPMVGRGQNAPYGGGNRHERQWNEEDSDEELDQQQPVPRRDVGNFIGEQPQQFREDHREHRLRVDIPYFNGTFRVEEFLDWLADVERYFTYTETAEERKVKLVSCRLKGCASVWWERLNARRQQEGRGPIRTWYTMKTLLQTEFLPQDYEQILFQKYEECRQGSRDVHEYMLEFTRLSERCDLRESESQQVGKFLRGLRPMIRDRIGVQVITTLTTAKNLALKAEQLVQERGRPTEGHRYGNYNNRNNNLQGDQPQPTKPDKTPEEAAKARRKTINPPISTRPQTTYDRPISGNCFKCRQPGHRSSDCPLRKAIQMVERQPDMEEVYCAPEEEDGEDRDEGEHESDTDEERNSLMVIQKVMLTPRAENQSLRNQLFRTKCDVQGSIFDVIIDNGSCENIVGKKVVEKLGLQTEKHPNPYSISWINSAGLIRITERCRIPFSIARFKDEAYFDVVEMDACHFLLGRPWQFDTAAAYEGRENVHKVERDGIKYILLPVKNCPKQKNEKAG